MVVHQSCWWVVVVVAMLTVVVVVAVVAVVVVVFVIVVVGDVSLVLFLCLSVLQIITCKSVYSVSYNQSVC